MELTGVDGEPEETAEWIKTEIRTGRGMSVKNREANQEGLSTQPSISGSKSFSHFSWFWLLWQK